MDMSVIWLGFAGGALAFVHCLGMCGGFALHLSRGRPSAVLGRQLLWHAGKTFTYVFLGAVAGFGGSLIHSLPGIPWAQKALAFGASGVMILMGLALLGLLPAFARAGSAAQEDGLLASVVRSFVRQPNAPGALALGLATGFLPCPIVLAFLAYSAHSGSVLTGMLTMAAVGVGTLWSLLLLGITGQLIHARIRRWGSVAAGVVLVALGLVTALRGTDALHRVLGCHGRTGTPAPIFSSQRPCCEQPHAVAAPSGTHGTKEQE